MKALIFGITGQDGSYLAELLLEKGYEVHGMVRRSATGNTKNIDHILDKLHIHWGDLSDHLSLEEVIVKVQPDEFYNQADQDLAGRSWHFPNYNYDVTASAVGAILRILQKYPKIKYLQPISSNIFGNTETKSQNENTPHNPQSPYAVAKSAALNMVRMYRNLGVNASTAILYNHESPRRTMEYVTKKIANAAARIKLGLQDHIELGDLSSEIDWGWSPEYVEAEWKILQQKEPDDFIIATGETHSVREFAEEAFKVAGLFFDNHYKINPAFMRPVKNSTLKGDYSKAKKTFGFEPKVRFINVVEKMVKHELQNTRK